uniref:Large ribosomal subunit protein uL4c n=1 Tax=Helminthocladia australis TaxID=260093 RepID=A0A1G4NTL9_9FLOR|nr:Ribosomal protein L4 [Helminthocladia australis]SCW22000.1 Ribosomal protein L4 [Helminthocladia australis]
MSTEQTIKYKIYTDKNLEKETKTIKLKTSNLNSGYIIHRSLIRQMEESRQGTACTKTRSEVRGGGRKPWKQKGTGKARAGSIRSPLWRGGGVIFGPKPKNYKLKINAKEKQLALRNLLANKANYVTVINENDLEINIPKTKEIQKKLSSFGIVAQQKCLIIVKQKSNNLYLAIRNLPDVELVQANHLNILLLLKAKQILVTKDALSTIEAIYNA